jgi:predicted nucleic acid-binding protein
LTVLVLDASVAVKWALPSSIPSSMPSSNETLTAESLELLKRYVEGSLHFLVPDIFWAEVGNVFWKGVRQQRWQLSFAEAATSHLRNWDFHTVSSQALLPEALKIAFAYDRSVYDCLYVALAIQFNTEMITADEQLANALAARLPVKWLGAFAPGRI